MSKCRCIPECTAERGDDHAFMGIPEKRMIRILHIVNSLMPEIMLIIDEGDHHAEIREFTKAETDFFYSALADAFGDSTDE
jgi:hypothetical protein